MNKNIVNKPERKVDIEYMVLERENNISEKKKNKVSGFLISMVIHLVILLISIIFFSYNCNISFFNYINNNFENFDTKNPNHLLNSSRLEVSIKDYRFIEDAKMKVNGEENIKINQPLSNNNHQDVSSSEMKSIFFNEFQEETEKVIISLDFENDQEDIVIEEDKTNIKENNIQLDIQENSDELNNIDFNEEISINESNEQENVTEIKEEVIVKELEELSDINILQLTKDKEFIDLLNINDYKLYFGIGNTL